MGMTIARQRAHARARQRALQNLAYEFPARYRELLEAEKAKEGIQKLMPRQVIEQALKEATG